MNRDRILKHLPKSHPVLCELNIDCVDLYQFECLSENHPETNIMGQDSAENGRVRVFVACASEDVAKLLDNAWS